MNPEELKHIAVLQTMDDAALARLAAVSEEKDYADGQVVFAEGDPGDSMYFIIEGRVRIEKRAQAAGTSHKTLTVLEAGDYFGEMALLDQKPRSAAAVAAGPTRILRLSKAAFDTLQQKSSAAAMNVLFAMIRTSGDRIRRLSAHLVVYDEVGKAIGEAQDLQALLNVILQQLSSATSADWGLVVLRPQFSEGLELRGQANLELNAEQRNAIANGQGFLGPALQNPQDRLVENLDGQEPFKSCPRLGFETPSLLLSPITVEGQFLGLIVLGGKALAQFNLDALNIARGVARQAGQAILNARHREEEQARSRHSRQFVRF
jgi:CRP-like cAMP-binding protein